METIKNYLETMFQNMPNTLEVKRARHELGQMMEDKYQELKSEGKSENEAVGTVISEFGNLDELAEDLGISGYIQNAGVTEYRMVSLDEVKAYISEKTRYGFMIAMGVMLCIISVCGVIISDDEVVGLVFLFLCIAVAVGLFVFSGVASGKWDYLTSEPCSIDFATAEYVNNQKENYRMTNALMNTLGVAMCVLCVVPLVVIDSLNMGDAMELIGTDILLICVAVGVFMFVATGNKKAAYNTILKLNGQDTIGGNYFPSQKGRVHYNNKTLAAVMSVYWPTVTCIYLCVSFLSTAWHATWIIWCIAGIFESFIKNMNKE